MQFRFQTARGNRPHRLECGYLVRLVGKAYLIGQVDGIFQGTESRHGIAPGGTRVAHGIEGVSGEIGFTLLYRRIESLFGQFRRTLILAAAQRIPAHAVEQHSPWMLTLHVIQPQQRRGVGRVIIQFFQYHLLDIGTRGYITVVAQTVEQRDSRRSVAHHDVGRSKVHAVEHRDVVRSGKPVERIGTVVGGNGTLGVADIIQQVAKLGIQCPGEKIVAGSAEIIQAAHRTLIRGYIAHRAVVGMPCHAVVQIRTGGGIHAPEQRCEHRVGCRHIALHA